MRKHTSKAEPVYQNGEVYDATRLRIASQLSTWDTMNGRCMLLDFRAASRCGEQVVSPPSDPQS
jgi:hypothetical protein